jgi:hypothetical protein
MQAAVDIPTVAKKPMVLREHSDEDRCDRVNKLVEADKATLFWSIHSDHERILCCPQNVSNANENRLHINRPRASSNA